MMIIMKLDIKPCLSESPMNQWMLMPFTLVTCSKALVYSSCDFSKAWEKKRTIQDDHTKDAQLFNENPV